jgi:hypothetical protein
MLAPCLPFRVLTRNEESMANGIGGAMAIEHGVERRIPWLARAGAMGEGFVFLAIGAVSGLGALSARAEPRGPASALSTVSRQFAGLPLLWVVGLGLLALVVWQLMAAFLDAENHGSDAAGIAKRAGELVGAVLYAGLAFWALRSAAGMAAGSGGDERSTDELAAAALRQPFGRGLVIAAAIAVLAFALADVVRAFRHDLGDRLSYDLTGGSRRFAIAIGRIGLFARGIVFGVIAFYLGRVAWSGQADEARGIAGALSALQDRPYGIWLMSAVALSLALFGVWRLIQGLWMRVDVHVG